MPTWSARGPRVLKATAAETLPGRRGRQEPGRGSSGGTCCSSGTRRDRAGKFTSPSTRRPLPSGGGKTGGEPSKPAVLSSLPTEGKLRCLHRYVRRHTARLSHALRRLALDLETPPRSAPVAGRDDVTGARRTFPAHAARAGRRGGLAKGSRHSLSFFPLQRTLATMARDRP